MAPYPPQDTLNTFNVFEEDPIVSAITLATSLLIIIAFLAFLTHRAVVHRRKDRLSRIERLQAAREEARYWAPLDLEPGWDGSEDEGWGLDGLEDGVTGSVERVQMRRLEAERRVREFGDGDWEEIEVVGGYLQQL